MILSVYTSDNQRALSRFLPIMYRQGIVSVFHHHAWPPGPHFLLICPHSLG